MAVKTELLPRDGRGKMAKTENGQKIVSLFLELMEKQSIVNNGAFLIRQLAEDSEEKLSYAAWEKYYFLLADKKTKTDNAQYYGKSIRELQTLSKKLLVAAKRKGIGSDENLIWNLTYYTLVDEPYVKYLNDMKVCKKLVKKYPDIFFTLSSAMSYLENDIDIFGYQTATGELIKAVKIVPHGENIDEMSLTGQKHQIFQNLYGIQVDYLS